MRHPAPMSQSYCFKWHSFSGVRVQYKWNAHVNKLKPTILPPFRRRHFQMYFLEWKRINFDCECNEVCFHGSSYLMNPIPALVQKMAWHQPSDKPSSQPMMVSLLTHICVTRPQWVKGQVTEMYRLKLRNTESQCNTTKFIRMYGFTIGQTLRPFFLKQSDTNNNGVINMITVRSLI